ncbi:MAG: hypothetical protein ACXVX8_18175 [Blastococcus sp.]
MSTLLASPAPVGDATQLIAGATPSPRRFLAGYALTLLVPLVGLAVLLTGWTLARATGWPAATAATVGWSMTVIAGLRHRGWPPVMAHLASWACPTALLALLAELGWLSAGGLVLWGPVSAVLAVAVVSAYRPGLIWPPHRPSTPE